MLTWIYFHGSEISEKILQVSGRFWLNRQLINRQPFPTVCAPRFVSISVFLFLRGTAGQFESQFVM
jgi:hypothetical protein